jgi:hypothetical protein
LGLVVVSELLLEMADPCYNLRGIGRAELVFKQCSVGQWAGLRRGARALVRRGRLVRMGQRGYTPVTRCGADRDGAPERCVEDNSERPSVRFEREVN